MPKSFPFDYLKNIFDNILMASEYTWQRIAIKILRLRASPILVLIFMVRHLFLKKKLRKASQKSLCYLNVSKVNDNSSIYHFGLATVLQ